MALVMQVSARLEDLTQSYVPAYAALARANIHSLTRAIALRRMLIEKARSPVDAAQLAATVNDFRAEGEAVDSELKGRTRVDRWPDREGQPFRRHHTVGSNLATVSPT